MGYNANKEILYIGGFELPDKNAAAQRVIGNGKILRELGFDVYYLGSDQGLLKNEPLKHSVDTFEGFKFYKVKYPTKLSEWFIYLFSTANVVKLIDELPKLNFIIAYNYPAPALAKLNRLCKKRNIKLIADCTEWYVPEGGIVYKTIKGFDTYLRMRIVHPKLDGIIAISKYLYDFYLIRMSGAVVQLPPLVDSSSEKWQNSFINYEEELNLVYAGSPGKGSKDRIDAIIKAFSTIKKDMSINFSLNIIGLTRQQYIDDFGDEFLTGELETCVVFAGRLSHTDTLKKIKNADYAIFIRDNNLINTAGFPTKFVEALSCGTPVLTNLYSNVSDYLENGKNGYILDTTTDEALVQTLAVALSQSKEKINEMKRLIKKQDRFDYRKYIDIVNSFLKTITE